MAPQLYNPIYKHYPSHDAFPEGYVFECPYHPGGPLAVTTHRGYFGALRATVYCTHAGCHFSAYDDGTVASPSHCAVAREARVNNGREDLKPNMRMPFSCLIYRRKWDLQNADSSGRVVIPAEVSSVPERVPGAPVPPAKSPDMINCKIRRFPPGAYCPSQATDVQESPIPPSSMEERGSSCFGNGIKGGWKKQAAPKTSEARDEDKRPAETLASPEEIQLVMDNVPPPPPEKPQPPPMIRDVKVAEDPSVHPIQDGVEVIYEIDTDSQDTMASDDGYVNVPSTPELKANRPSRWHTIRNIHYRDPAYNNSALPGLDSFQSDKRPPEETNLSPEIYPGAVHKSTKLMDENNPTVHDLNIVNVEKQSPPPPSREVSAATVSARDSTDDVDSLSAESIANLVLRLAEIPERLTMLERVNAATSKSVDAKNTKIKHLEESLERVHAREKDLEAIIFMYERAGRRGQVSPLT